MSAKPPRREILDIAKGDAEEAELLEAALRKGRSERLVASLDNSTIQIRRYVTTREGPQYRDLQRLTNQVLKLQTAQVAYRDPPDVVREEFAAFAYLMYLGYQVRFLDKHPQETAQEFLDRPGKVTVNLTRLVVDVLSQLYHRPPVREVLNAGELTPEVHAALHAAWCDEYNLALLEADRYTRLLGTVAVRPFYDPTCPGKTRLWIFLSHQIRVIEDPDRPWGARAVIERHDPFTQNGRIVVWTPRSWVVTQGAQVVGGGQHGMGRVPHTFLRERVSYTSFFSEGRGRGLADANAVINNRLTALSEVVEMQGFSVAQIFNSDEDDPSVSPRTALHFRTVPGEENFRRGLEYAKPNAPIQELINEIEFQVRHLLRANRVPEAVVGIDLGRRALSGVAVRQAMAPILEDLEERARRFTTYEMDLADALLRVRAEHDDDFDYDGEMPRLVVRYQKPEFPLDARAEVERDRFYVEEGVLTPADIIRRLDPGRYQSREEAVVAWRRNLEERGRDDDGEPAGRDSDSDRAGDSLEEAMLEEAAQGSPLMADLISLAESYNGGG